MVKTSVLIFLYFQVAVSSSSTAIAAGVDSLCGGSVGLSSGQWAEYATDAPLIKQKVKGRYAVVGTEAGHYWFEVETATPMGSGGMIVKILIPGWPYTTQEVKRALMQLPRIEGMDAIPPIEMPPSSVQGGNLSDPLRMACEELENEAVESVRESVTVAAGTFSAMRIPVRQLGKDVWVSTAVPFGIVKMVDEDGYGVVLTAYGNDAVPAITETPQGLPGTGEQLSTKVRPESGKEHNDD